MKKIIFAVAALVMLSAGTVKAQQAETYPSYVSVNGISEREVVPNEIYVSIVINENDGKKVTVAEQERKMVEKLRALGINVDKDLQVGDMSGNLQNYVFRRDQVQTVKNYILKVNSAEMLGKVFSSLSSINISQMNVVKATRNDLEQIKSEMRAEAVKNAKMTAETLAGAIGQKAGKAFYIQDNNYGNGVVYYDSMVMARGKMSASAETYEEPTLEFQNIKLTVNVSAKFILE